MNPSPDRCVLLTPPGAGAIAVVRLQGPHASEILERVFHPVSRQSGGDRPSNSIAYGRIVGSDSFVVDDVLVATIPSPALRRSCRQKAFDISMHGGIRVVERVITVLAESGAHHATMQEIDQDLWAISNKVDREITHELCRAKTHRAVRFLANQRTALVKALEDVAASCRTNASEARKALTRLVGSHQAATVLLRGARIVLVGAPNSGKSTLFNQLTGRRAAVVSPHAGTTRDWVEASVEFNGIPIDLVDTAGVGIPTDDLEQLAISMGQTVAADCDLVIHVRDAMQHADPDSHSEPTVADNGPPTLLAISKSDLSGPSFAQSVNPGEPCRISAKTGAGMSNLIRACVDRLLGPAGFDDAAPHLLNDRQVAVAKKALVFMDGEPDEAAALIGCELIGHNTA